ncbi:MAG: hypothetical protein ACLU5H_02085 [Alphaproteobacteria bacterium]|jgi:hypothetical protein
MMDIIADLQKDLIDPTKKLSTILSKAYLVAQKLELNEMAEWLNFEISGYKCGNDCPDYRTIKGILKGRNPFTNWAVIPIADKEIEKALSHFTQTGCITELESVVSKGQDVYNPLPTDIISQLGLDSLTQLGVFCPARAFQPIIEAARKTLIDWTIKLEKKGIRGENMSFMENEIHNAKETVPTTIINNFSGNVQGLQIAQGNETVRQSQDNNKKTTGFLSMLLNGIKNFFGWWKNK